MKLDFYRPTALITGASTGIGRAIAQRLAEDGFRVLVNYKHSSSDRLALSFASALREKKRECFLIRADVSKESEVKKMMEAVQKKFGILDVVVNNAGINQTKQFNRTRLTDFKDVVDVNLYGGILVVSHALPMLKKAKSPRVIFISSATAFLGSKNRSAYVVSKSALLGLHRALALDLAPQILVNSVVPGYVDTELFRKSNRRPVSEKIARIPLRRIGKPEDIAGAVSFLCSKHASYITGQSIHVNGGLFFT